MADATIFDTCQQQVMLSGSNATSSYEALAKCVSDAFELSRANDKVNVNHWLFVLAGSLVFIMQTGFAMLCAGCVRKKNVQNTMLKNLLDACGAALAFYVMGYALAFGGQDSVVGTTFIGTTNFFLSGSDVNPGYWFFEWAFSASTVTIIAGTLAERCQMIAYLTYSFFLPGFVYPVIAHSVWSNNGFLSVSCVNPLLGCGAIDFAGSGVVHVTGGTTSLIAMYILGARRGRFHDERGRPLDEPNPMPGHSVALQLLGTMILWFGWYGFNPGSALTYTNAKSQGAVAAVAAVNTSLSAASGAISGMLINLYVQERRTGESHYDLTAAMNGCLAGLVAITASCGVIEYWASLVIGAVAGGLYLVGSAALIKYRLDDAVDAVPVHLVNGAWGVLATGLFASPGRCQDAFGPTFTHAGLFYTFKTGVDFTLLLNQVVQLSFIMGWVFVTMFPFFMWLNYMGWFRSDSLEELVGLDISYHGGNQYEEEMVQEELIKAFADKKGLRRRKVGSRHSTAQDGSGDDNDMEVGSGDADSVSWAGFDAGSSSADAKKKAVPKETHPSSSRTSSNKKNKKNIQEFVTL